MATSWPGARRVSWRSREQHLTPARSAIERTTSVPAALSAVATTAHDERCFHAGGPFGSEKANSVKIKLSSNLLELTAQSPDFGEAHESMAIGYSGPDLQVAFNPTFLMDPLKALSKDEVFFEVKDEVSPGVFKTLENFVCVIMPVRLS